MEWYEKTVSEKLGLDVKTSARSTLNAQSIKTMEPVKESFKVITKNTETKFFDLQVFKQSKNPVELSFEQNEILKIKRKERCYTCHNYQIEPIQQVADYIGDSLGLARQASKTNADIIVFCGVHFMAETAKILNPKKTVLLPDLDAGCSLSDSCPATQLSTYKAQNPHTYVVAYVNCSAEVKALSDVICTSGNAVQIVEKAPKDKEILFVPDQNLVNGS